MFSGLMVPFAYAKLPKILGQNTLTNTQHKTLLGPR